MNSFYAFLQPIEIKFTIKVIKRIEFSYHTANLCNFLNAHTINENVEDNLINIA